MEQILSKAEFQEYFGNTHSVILLNTVERTLSYQVLRSVMQMPVIEGIEIIDCGGKQLEDPIRKPARIIANAKTGFKKQVVVNDVMEEVVFTYGWHLDEAQMKTMRDFCISSEFETFRGKEMSMNDEGYIGYRDEVRLYFTAITDSPMPLIRLPMNYYYDEKHIWPNEKLYRHIVKTYFEGNKALKGYPLSYGGLSLFS